jgi:hypothetical protein
MSATFIDLAGAALLHSLWQGAVIAGLLALVLQLLGSTSPGLRYLVCWAALVAMVAAPVWTVVPGGSDGQAGLGGQGAVDPMAAPEVGTPEVLGGAVDLTPAAVGVAVRPFLAAFWLLGVLVMTVRLIFGWWSVQQLRRLPGQALSDALVEVVARLRSRLGIPRAVQVVGTDRVAEPLLIGWLKPVVLVPSMTTAGIDICSTEASRWCISPTWRFSEKQSPS